SCQSSEPGKEAGPLPKRAQAPDNESCLLDFLFQPVEFALIAATLVPVSPCDHAILPCDCAQQHHTAAEAGNRNSQPVENEQYRRHRPVDELAPLEVHLPSEFATMERAQLIPGKRSGNDCRSPAHGV